MSAKLNQLFLTVLALCGTLCHGASSVEARSISKGHEGLGPGCHSIPNHGHKHKTCVVSAHEDGSDDSDAIDKAFERCSRDARVVFTNTTYHVGKVLTTTDLHNVEVDIHGTLLWSDDLTYWLNNSMQVGYQNQSTVWFLGGTGLKVNGFGHGTLDGNGQAWYDLVQGISNYPDRPMGLTVWEAKDSVFTGLRLVQSQMWTMAIMHSQNVLFEDIYVHSESTSGAPARNTDGCDTIYSDHLTFRGWQVDNGDDAIALKANSTNILIEDCDFSTGQGLAFGSIGQYAGRFETIENVLARRLTLNGTKYGAYIKTWTGDEVDYPPNGGGAGLGYINNIVLEDFTLNSVRAQALSITQCTTYSGTTGDCDSSLFEVENITATGFTGSIGSTEVANVQCSEASGGCGTLTFEDMDLTYTGNSTEAVTYVCSNVDSCVGFECTDCPDSSCGAHGS